MNQILSTVNHVPTNYEEQDDFRPQKRFKLDSEAAASKANSYGSRDDFKRGSDFKRGGITTGETKFQEQIKPGGGSRVEVHLANAELWKELNAIGNEISIDASAR